jgi:hypothetical protein
MPQTHGATTQRQPYAGKYRYMSGYAPAGRYVYAAPYGIQTQPYCVV